MSASMAEIQTLYSPNTEQRRRSVRAYKGTADVCSGYKV